MYSSSYIVKRNSFIKLISRYFKKFLFADIVSISDGTGKTLTIEEYIGSYLDEKYDIALHPEIEPLTAPLCMKEGFILACRQNEVLLKALGFDENVLSSYVESMQKIIDSFDNFFSTSLIKDEKIDLFDFLDSSVEDRDDA